MNRMPDHLRTKIDWLRQESATRRISPTGQRAAVPPPLVVPEKQQSGAIICWCAAMVLAGLLIWGIVAFVENM